jgi:hypothetical protein
MNIDGINQLVRDVFGANWETKEIGGWVSMRCPLAPWKHRSGRDSRPSAGISIHEHDTSVYNCMTCHTRVPLQGLVREYAEFTGEDLSDLIEELEDEAYLGPRELPGWKQRREDPALEEPIILNKELHLDLYDPAAGHWYLATRGITDETANRLQLKVDPRDSEGEERILFPVFSPDGDLHGFSGRAISKDARIKVRDYAGLKKAGCLLGAHLITETKPDKIILVEGLFDYANGWQQGYPTTAIMSSTLTQLQARIVRDFGLPAYGFFDDDEAGADCTEKAGALIAPYQPFMKVRYPEIWIEDENEEDGGHWVKDPGELLAEDFAAMIADARLF